MRLPRRTALHVDIEWRIVLLRDRPKVELGQISFFGHARIASDAWAA